MYNSQGILQASSARSNIVSVVRNNQGVGLPQQYENYSPQEQQEVQEVQENYDQKGDGIVSLRKLYFTMLVQLAIAITLNALRIPFVENILISYPFLGFIFIGLFVLFALMATLPQFETLPLNAVIYIVFGLNLYLLSSWLTTYFSIEQSLMAQLMIGGQILAQFLSVLQVKIELYFHQQALYVLASALIVFQLFIIYTGISFQEMILTLILGIIFGFLLVYGTQTQLRYNINDILSGSVRAYFDVISVFLYTNKLLIDGMVQINKIYQKMNQAGYDVYSDNEQNEVNENNIQPGIELRYLQKMYLMMALQYIITIPLTYIQFQCIEDIFTQYQYGIYIISAVLFILSYAGTFFKKIPMNCILYIIFVFVLYILFANLIVITNIEQTLMVQILILGQIIAQLILVLQTKQKIKYHQGFIYVLYSGMLIFQLFIIQSSIGFYEMIIIYVIALVYGSLLIYATQTNLRDYASVCSTPDYIKDAISGSVRAQFDISRTMCYGAQLIKALVFDDRKLLIASQDFSEKYQQY